MDLLDPKNLNYGDEVFVIYRNPHVPSVSNIKAGEIVPHPKDPNQYALFLNETLHVIEDDDALYATQAAAEQAYLEAMDPYST
ncbi:transcriptional regulator SplA domain-containing protein [Mesobacillus subterraneus]|uniref:transcriptional regulator SplA domain-containing protein n=1 Tax=Mesobacillus subterraneus TaxID=285983 RepID=UPI001CFE7D03|nr:transcriptional regulator SplA domain-containing protein [Mesobacillus subterraneus]WLR56829.1 transcriptional regulator SplA domain-containing protein [Mesobacillus subterraneus]